MNRSSGAKLADNDMEFILCEIRARILKRRMIHCFERSDREDIRVLGQYLRRNAVTVFPYEFTKQYDLRNVTVRKDLDKGMLYVLDRDRKIYLRRKYHSIFRAQRYYNGILLEQDIRSPHRYTSDIFRPPRGCVIFDVGGAEGYFSLQYIDVADKIYIFECNEEWNEALRCTFSRYGDKVEVVNKIITDYTDETHICLDDFIEQRNLQNEAIFIKVDAEGYEPLIVRGLRKAIVSQKQLYLALCTYHVAEHKEMLASVFQGWQTEQSDGYMLYYYDFNFKSPYVRNGILRAWRT